MSAGYVVARFNIGVEMNIENKLKNLSEKEREEFLNKVKKFQEWEDKYVKQYPSEHGTYAS